MTHAIDVARYLLHLAASQTSTPEDIDSPSHLRLQKLLYYAQGWYLAMTGSPLFSERIEAWKHGPVVKDVYHVFSNFGYQAIPPDQGASGDNLTSIQKLTVQSVWAMYKEYSATALSRMTHEEEPWRKARLGVSDGESCQEEISHDSMHEFFLKLMIEKLKLQDNRINPESWAQSAREIRAGQVLTIEETRLELRRLRSAKHQIADLPA